MQRVMCIWIPDWPVQRLALQRPDLHGRTVVLYEATPQGGLKVVAASAALGVRDSGPIAGIYPGMPLAEAVALAASVRSGELNSDRQKKRQVVSSPTGAASCHSPHLEPACPETDCLALEQLAEWCQRFSPIAGVEEAARPECLLLDVTGLAYLFGGEDALIEQVARDFSGRGLNARIAVADTIGVAWAAVHANEYLLTAETIPHSLLSLPRGKTLAALAPLPIGYLRVADETVDLLATLGITRVGQLAALPRSALLARFGSALLWRFDQATGDAPETILARHASPEYTADFSFEAPISNREAIEHVLGELIAQITEPLARRREGVLRLVCRLKFERAFEQDLKDSRQSSFSLGLFRPSASPTYLRDLLRLRLENVRLPGPVIGVRVEATAIGPLELRQQGMFESDTDHEQSRRLGELVDRLSNRLGRNGVVQAALLPDAQPEYTCIDVPLAGGYGPRGMNSIGNALRGVLRAPNDLAMPTRRMQRHRARSLPKGAGYWAGSPKKAKKNLMHINRYGLLSFAADERPLVLLPQPARIETSTGIDGAPVRFRWDGRTYSIASTWGPERIETGWWRTESLDQKKRRTFVRRDYYRVETTSGARFWIFHSLVDRQWFMQGTFD